MIFNMVGGGGGSSDLSSIIADVESGSTVKCTKGPIILTGMSDGTVRFDDLENGTWNLKATKDNLSADTTVNITKFQIYYVTMSYFTATIQVTFPADATSVTCVNGSTTLSVPSGSLASGSYTFTVHAKGTWTLTAKKGTTDTDTATVDVQAEQMYTVNLLFGLWLFKEGVGELGIPYKNTDDGVTITVTKNSITRTGGTWADYGYSNVDFTKYSTLKVEAMCNDQGGTFLFKIKRETSDFSALLTKELNATGARVINSIDVSNISDLAYAFVNSGSKAWTIYNMWLE